MRPAEPATPCSPVVDKAGAGAEAKVGLWVQAGEIRAVGCPGALKGLLGLNIRALSPADRDWVARHVAEHWGAEIVVAHGTLYHPAALPGFVAEAGGEVVGLGHLPH